MKSRKRFISIIVVLALTLCVVPTGFAADGIKVTLNGQQLKLSKEPYATSGTTMLPMRDIFESLGYTVTWNQEDQTVLANNAFDQLYILAKLGSKTMYATPASVVEQPRGKADDPAYAIEMPQPLEAKDGSTYIPVRAVSEAAGYNVTWNAATRTVVITTGEPAPNRFYDNTYILAFDNICRMKPTGTSSADYMTSCLYAIPKTLTFQGWYNQYVNALKSYSFEAPQDAGDGMYILRNPYIDSAVIIQSKYAADGYFACSYTSHLSKIVGGSSLTTTTTAENDNKVAEAEKLILECKSIIRQAKDEISDLKSERRQIQKERDNASQERNVRVYSGGRWIYTADEELLEYYDDYLDMIDEYIEEYEEIIDENEIRIEELEKAIEQYQNSK